MLARFELIDYHFIKDRGQSVCLHAKISFRIVITTRTTHWKEKNTLSIGCLIMDFRNHLVTIREKKAPVVVGCNK